MHPAGGKGEEDGAQENQGMDPGKEKVCCQSMPATVMAARMEDVTGERDPWQDSPDPWAGLLNRCNLEETRHSSIDSIGLTSANTNLIICADRPTEHV